MKLAKTLTVLCGMIAGFAATGAACATDITLGLIPIGMDTFGTGLVRGFEAEAKTLGARVIVIDAKYSVETMGNGIDDLTAQGVNGIAFAPIDAVVAMGWVDKLVAEKIPVVAVSTLVGDPAKMNATDVYPGLFSYVNHDDVLMGSMSGELAVSLLPKDRKGRIAIVAGMPGPAVVEQRRAGFIGALDKSKVDYEIVADQPTDWSPESAEAVCQNILTANPDVDVFFTMADQLGVGCSHALDSSKSKAKIVSGAGGTTFGNEQIAAGAFVGSTCVRPETMGRLAARSLFEAVSDPKAVAGKFIPYDVTMVTKDTLASCSPEW